MNSVIKNISKKVIEGGVEVLKDSAEQLKDTVSPGKLIEQALGTAPKKPDELTEYLKSLGPDASAEELKKREEELSEEEKRKMEEARKTIKAAVPPHMRPQPRPPELRSYEKMLREQEQKKALEIEAQKKQQLIPPSGKQQSGALFVKKKKGLATPILSSSEGLKKDRKIG